LSPYSWQCLESQVLGLGPALAGKFHTQQITFFTRHRTHTLYMTKLATCENVMQLLATVT